MRSFGPDLVNGTAHVPPRGTRRPPSWAGLAWAVLALLGCPAQPTILLPGLTRADHAAYFPIESGPHAVDCKQCHARPESFAFDCLGCHEHEPVATNLLHETTPEYVYESQACLSCHAQGVQRPTFDHGPGRDRCATCHDEGAAFAALPLAGFTHPPRGALDCSACHFSVTDWGEVSGAPGNLVADPLAAVLVSALLPTYAGTSMVSVSASLQTLPMPMDHTSAAFDPALTSDCATCHDETTTYYPGRLHSSLANLQVDQPRSCADCHRASAPTGFVGVLALDPPRDPATGEMKHDAVVWLNNQPTTSGLVPAECGLCHQPPSQALPATWAEGAGRPLFHAPLSTAGLPQPESCIDCHANGRPTLVYDEDNAPLPAGIVFDHAGAFSQGDCGACHAQSTSTWANGQFHALAQGTPPTCLPCHEGERPTSTADWESTTFTSSPFDFVTNASGIAHGDGQDCVGCHTSDESWRGGFFSHAPGTVADETCIACHSTQRADLVRADSALLLGFDHASGGTGDCIGCHQATVAAGTYVDLFNAEGTFPGGHWQGGVAYPGDVVISSPDQFLTLEELILVRSGPHNLITSMSPIRATFFDGMLHTSSTLPPALRAGPPEAPDATTCWHCHTNDDGVVSSFSNGQLHDALATFREVPGGPIAEQPQPTACFDCHVQMHPTHIVQGPAGFLQPLSHDAFFVTPVNLGGQTISGSAEVDCGFCHTDPGGSWAGARWHVNIGTGVAQDCAVCHYPTMANPAADVTNGTTYAMKHASSQLTLQNCKICHATAFSRATQTPLAASQWRDGALHPFMAPQPTGCLDCHTVSSPNTSTQGTVVYTLAQGASATNAGQWMNHGSIFAAGRDCVLCHAADARTTNSAWSRATRLHDAVDVNACSVCHGTANGQGTVAGTRNNMPQGLIDAATVSSAPSNPATGLPSGARDRISHDDINVTSHDCNFCHTQVGPSTAAGVSGREWAQAHFHARFDAANPLLMNTTTGRCANCHLNLNPGPAFGFSHAIFSNQPGSTDCSSCHSWPGTSASAPNWLGAAGGFPPIIATGGFLVPQPPALNTGTTATAIANLPHPTPGATACTACHTQPTGGKQAIGYDHASALANGKCKSCHEAGSNLVSPVWNGATTVVAGAGDTRPFTIASLRVVFAGNNLTVSGGNHFFPVDCFECHNAPTGLSVGTIGPTYLARWDFPHRQNRMANPSTCRLCHGNNIP